MRDLNLIPDDLMLPSMVHTRARGQNGVVILEFETTPQGHAQGFRHQAHKSTIHVPILPLDAAGLLRSLNKLQQAGLIPHVVEPNSPQQAN